MYESQTFETIIKRMLDKVPNTFDKREGSIIYDAVAPAAAELAQMYIELDVVINESFADTESREFLIRRAAELGVIPYPSTYAVFKAEFNINVPIGTRFSMDKYNYVITEKIDECIYKVQCETIGSDPNRYTGRLIPIDYIDGLESAKLTELIVPGEDEEDTEDFRTRYIEALNSDAYGGNISDYKNKVKAIGGVGNVRVYPVWNGGGTVKLVINDSDYNVPTDSLLQEVQTKIDPVTNSGKGYGIAPVGHIVTVFGVKETNIDIETELTLEDGYVLDDVVGQLESSYQAYINRLREQWGDTALVVRLSYLDNIALEIGGILDVANTKINGQLKNFTLDDDFTPKLGAVVING